MRSTIARHHLLLHGIVVSPLFLRGDLCLIATEDEAGTIIVKRYRLVLPGGA
jgi:hypothetical protein